MLLSVVAVSGTVARAAGYTPAGGPWKSIGPFASYVNHVSVHPTDSRTLYAATGFLEGAGVFKSTDAGATWAPLWIGIPKDTPIDCVEVDRTDPDVIYAGALYIGAGDPLSLSALYKSTDAGAHWAPSATGMPYSVSWVFTIVSDPTRPGTVFAGTSQGIYRSTDRGGHWTPSDMGPEGPDQVYGIALDAGGSDTMFAAGYYALYRSADRGRSWKHLKGEIPEVFAPKQVVMHPFRPDTVYVVDSCCEILKSEDGGRTWRSLDVPRDDLPPYHRWSIAVEPSGFGAIVYLGAGSRILRSIDGGASWEVTGTGLPPDLERVYDLISDPLRPGTLYAATHWGLYKSETQGRTWTSSNQGIASSSVAVMAIESGNNPVLYAPLDPDFPRSLLATTDLGRTWEWRSAGLRNAPLGGGSVLVTVPQHPGTVYWAGGRSSDGGKSVVFKSLDWGETWTLMFSNSGWYNELISFLVDPQEPERLYLAMYAREPVGVYGILKSEDGGKSWILTSPLPDKGVPYSMAIDPRDPSILYVGGYGRLWKSTDRGASWIESGNGLPDREIFAILVDPDNPRQIYAAFQFRGLYKSTDAAAHWSRADLGGERVYDVRAIAIDPLSPDTLYAGTMERGLFKSIDGGATWRSINRGLRSWWIMSILVDPLVPGRLFVGTGGTGIFMSTTGGE